ncbi:MAG: cyclase family protein [Planctomycetia bacterium]|nr:cyclase family protein [Planctomycetia bacterium]
MFYWDLTHPVTPQIPPFPGDSPVQIQTDLTIPENGCLVRTLTCSTHQGTHVDAPAHILPEGKTLDDFPLETFFPKAVVLEMPTLSPETGITLENLSLPDPFPFPGHALLLRTHWEQTAQRFDADYFRNAPFLLPETARWLSQQPIPILGFDLPSPDAFSNSALTCHHLLLEQEILLLENLTHLEPLPTRQPLELILLPLPIAQAEGAPARAVARLSHFQ